MIDRKHVSRKKVGIIALVKLYVYAYVLDILFAIFVLRFCPYFFSHENKRYANIYSLM